MDKVVDLLVDEKFRNRIREVAIDKRLPTNKILSETLKLWYKENKDRLDNKKCEIKINRCSIRIDSETEKIYKLFVEDTMNSLYNLVGKE
ncbi:TPA: hypothetical protein N2D99_002045 [Clostridium botulinum]|nr:hypothetical protein [Clostridium botulinum]